MNNYMKYTALASLMLFSFFQGMINIYIGGVENILGNTFHFKAPAFTTLTACLFFGNGVGCIIGGTLIDRYGAGTISSICGFIAVIGVFIFTMSHTFYAFGISEFIIGLGVSVWYPSGIEVLKIHFDPLKLPLLAGVFLFFNAIGSATISGVVYLSKTYGLFDADLCILTISIILAVALFITARTNNPDKINITTTLFQDYEAQILLMKNRIVIPVIISQTIPTVFSYVFLPLWAIPYMSMLLSPAEATIIVTGSLITYGAAGMILGKLYHKFFSPLGWMLIQYSGSFIAFAMLLYLPTSILNFWVVSLIMLIVSSLLGANNAYVATYLANLFEPRYTGTISAVYGYIFQFLISIITPMFGMALGSKSMGEHYTIANYNAALQYLLLSFAISTAIIITLKIITKGYPSLIKIRG